MEGRREALEDGGQHKQLGDGQRKNARLCGRGAGPLNQDCVSVTLLLSGRRAGQSRAHPLAGAMERPRAGAETGAGRLVLELKR